MTNLNIRIDGKLKTEAEAVLCRLGLTTSDAVRIFFSQIRNTQSIPFELKLPDSPSQQTIQAISEAEHDLKNHEINGPYHTVEALMTALNKD